MREIKFRQALFDRNGEFTGWHYWGFICDGQFVGVELGTSNHKQALGHSYQYTGLKDKNEVEIYEGDILRFENLPKLEIVEATDGGWNPFIDSMQTDSSWHYEVIGNIYENKELL